MRNTVSPRHLSDTNSSLIVDNTNVFSAHTPNLINLSNKRATYSPQTLLPYSTAHRVADTKD